jgi:hypothetical protein
MATPTQVLRDQANFQALTEEKKERKKKERKKAL